MASNVLYPRVQRSCDMVLNSVRTSSLNFSVQETPYSIYLTIRKSFSKSSDPQAQFLMAEQSDTIIDIESLSKKLSSSESEILSLKNKFEEAINECEIYTKEIEALGKKIKNSEQKNNVKEKALKDKDDLINLLKKENIDTKDKCNDSEMKLKELEKVVKSKSKEIHDIKKEHLKYNDDIDKLNSKCTDLVARLKSEEKLRKKEAKKHHNEQFSESLSCKVCEVKFQSISKLQAHVRIHHMEPKSVQTEDKCEIKSEKKIQVSRSDFSSEKSTDTSECEKTMFENYSCYYCSFNINSEKQLDYHVKHCSGSYKCFLQDYKAPIPHTSEASKPMPKSKIACEFPPPALNYPVPLCSSVGFSVQKLTQVFPYSPLPACVHCGWTANCGTDMVKHMKIVHNDYRSPFEVFKS